MEHEHHHAKRRRVERTFAGSIGGHMMKHGRVRAHTWSKSNEHAPIIAPNLVFPPSGDSPANALDTNRHTDDHPLEPPESQIGNSKFEVRQLLPTAVPSAVNKVSGPVNSAVNGVGSATAGLSSSPSNPATPVQDTSKLSKPVDNTPGLVSPLPAVAAEAAREAALQSQQAVANAKYAQPAVSPHPAGESPKPSSPAAGSQSPPPLNEHGSASQQALNPPATPLPHSSEASQAPASSYFPPSQPSSPAPSQPSSPAPSQPSSPAPSQPSSPAPSAAPNAVHNLQRPSGNNSTLSATSALNPSATSMLSSFSSASSESTSLASASSASAMTSSGSSAFAASTQSSQSVGTSSLSASPTTMMTFTSATSSLGSQTSSGVASSSSNASGANSGGLGAGGASNTGTAPSSASTSGPGSSGGGLTPQGKDLVGGIVGGVAGLVLIIAALLFLLRWRRRQTGQRRIISPPLPQERGAAGGGTMTQRSSNVPIAAAGFFGRLRPSSSNTAGTTDTAPSERGFQKISGRKLPSPYDNRAMSSGAPPAMPTGASAASPQAVAPGQGQYTGLAPALRPSPPQSMSGSSFYRDSHGFYGGAAPETSSDPADRSVSPGSSASPTYPPPLSVIGKAPGQGGSPSRRPEVANMRPGPARQPVINQPGSVPIRTPSRAKGPPSRPLLGTPPPIIEDPRDALGRSHPSQDGSRASRFKESTSLP